ncbi:uncharacterized protein LOC129302725 [Prosopis cineraria]|uniref:uncharacterized protein LOC129302725 n=1 Tax=Prosopis cineraria TaxID=364024 RepID=UPI00240F85C8|nr:uncharacterized protein LOC129302725 [Prosopis cineraria]
MIEALLRANDSGKSPFEHISPSKIDSCTVAQPFGQVPEGEHDCFFVVNSPNRHKVARSRVFNILKKNTKHNVLIPADYLRGLILEPIDANYPLPIPTLDAFTIGEASGNFIAWPRVCFYVQDKAQNRQVETAVPNQLSKTYQSALEAYAKLFADSTMLISFDQSMSHWMLIGIMPAAVKIAKFYYLDSTSEQPDMMELVNLAVVLYRTEKNLHVPLRYKSYDLAYPNWKIIKCLRQIAYSEDCGYCVMRFLKDIITHEMTLIPSAYYPDLYCKEFRDRHINEVIEE